MGTIIILILFTITIIIIIVEQEPQTSQYVATRRPGLIHYNILMYCTPTLSGGVSLMLHGVTTPNISPVDVRDILYHTAYSEDPSNANPDLHDQALLCVTDLIDCCRRPRT